jgi:hypothetical protein
MNCFIVPSLVKKCKKEPLERIPVENLPLTINYYREYLGFKLVNKTSNYATMRMQDKTVHLESGINKSLEKPTINIELQYNCKQMNNLFNEYRKKTKILKSLTETTNGFSEFAVLDCNDVEINFKNFLNSK